MQLPYTLKPCTMNDSTKRKMRSVARSVSAHSRQSGFVRERAATRGAGSAITPSAAASAGASSGRGEYSGSGVTCSMRIDCIFLPAAGQQDVDQPPGDRFDLERPGQQRSELGAP